MAVAFGNISNDTQGSGPFGVVPPAGLAVGDMIIVQLSSVGVGTSQTWSPPAGFDSIQNGGASADGTALSEQTFWKIATQADVDETLYVFTPSAGGGFQMSTIMNFSGSGTSIPVYAVNNVTANNTVTTTGLTPIANSMLVIIGIVGDNDATTDSQASYSIATSNPSWTERLDSFVDSKDQGHAVATGPRPEATATSTSTVISTPNASTTDVYFQVLLAIQPPVTTAYTLTAETSSCVLTGNETALIYTRHPDISTNTPKPAAASITNTPKPV